jgi:FkbM family methyltransferase
MLQKLIQIIRKIIPRGWGVFLRYASMLYPPITIYPAKLKNGDTLFVNIQQRMCLGYFFDGCILHSPGVDKLMSKILTPGCVFVDAGANIGYYSKLALRYIGNTGQVHAFEPLPSAFQLLQLNSIDFKKIIKLYPFALGDKNKEVEFFENINGDTSSLYPNFLAKNIKVKMVQLDRQLVNIKNLNLIKIDVEGYELEVLRGAINLLKKHHPVVVFEFLDGYSKKRQLSLKCYQLILEPIGYKLYYLNHSNNCNLLVTKLPSSDVVCVPKVWHNKLNLDINISI